MKQYIVTEMGNRSLHDIDKQLTNLADTGNTFTTIAHNPCLPGIIEKTFGFPGSIMIVEVKNEIVGYIPYSLVGKKFVSLPHFSYGGYCGMMEYKTEAYEFLLGTIFEKKGAFEIREFEKISTHNSTDKLTTILDLENTPEKQMSVFKSKLRSQITRGEKNGLSVRDGSLDLLPKFYGVYAVNMHHLGSPVLPLSFFKNILEDYRFGLARVFVVDYQEKAIGAAFLLSYLGFMEVCWASTIREYNHLSTNMTLYWALMKYSIDNNMSIFSFGRSSKESPTLRFKQQWGGRDLQLYWNYDQPKHVDAKKIGIASTVWKKLPAMVVNRIGPYISSRLY